jgi:predicted metalloprotease
VAAALIAAAVTLTAGIGSDASDADPAGVAAVGRASFEEPSTDEPLGSGGAAPQSAYSGDELEIAQSYLTTVIQRADQDWTVWFTANGLQEPMVSYKFVTPGETYTSNCKNYEGGALVVEADHPNAYYCQADALANGYDGTLILPLITMRRMWDGDILSRQVKEPGDFAAATMVAHEFGHHVADELVRQGVQSGPPATPKNVELLADCFAGNWVGAVYQQGSLGDQAPEYVDQAVATLQAVGDYNVNDPGHHGTPAERGNAIQIGLYGTQEDPRPATPAVCINQYWR